MIFGYPEALLRLLWVLCWDPKTTNAIARQFWYGAEMEYDPHNLEMGDRYKLLIGTIVPRPIALISTVSTTGQNNLAPFSFFAGVGSNPMTVLFCPANRPDGSEKDTLRNAKPVSEGGVGEFVINISTEAYASRMAAAAEPLPPEQSEFLFVDLTPTASRQVKPPRVLESPVCFECRTLSVTRTNGSEPLAGNVVLGEVVHIFVDAALVNEQMHVDATKLAAVGRMGGLEYCRTQDRFKMAMGKAALNQRRGEPF